jgi:predicted transcriptional regulator
MKTIKQIADEIGVSKTAVRNKITPDMKTKFAETVCGVVFISDEGERLIKTAFSEKKPQSKFAVVSANKFPQVSSEVSTLISMLQKELDIKNEQIRELNARLAEANAVMQTAQILHADTKKLLPDKQNGNTDLVETDAPTVGFFARIFGRRK